ncbi:hypothetical protein Noda2021_01470 [Candidatus Dependentiae bacterium Noda2021]|nr:hypothetical protein Noda2021_01470 [Candidatus Dependentiae bacterium Noda2021]
MKIPIKKILLALFAALAVALVVDYVRFKRTIKPGKKNITIIGQHIKPGSRAELLINAVIQRAQTKPDLRINVLDSADFNLRFLEAEKAPLEEPVDDYTTLQWSETIANADSILFITQNLMVGILGTLKMLLMCCGFRGTTSRLE